MDDSTSIFEKTFDPVYQAAIALGGVIVISILAKLLGLTGLVDIPQRFPWMSAASFMLLFAVFNSVFSLSSKKLMKYWARSFYSFMGLAAGAGLFAYLLSSLTIDQAGSYRWIYIVVTVGYLVFMSMMAMLRRIVNFAQREEWNHPRIRRK
jgi:drug/metabolite transporter (DMT)-like permease